MAAVCGVKVSGAVVSSAASGWKPTGSSWGTCPLKPTKGEHGIVYVHARMHVHMLHVHMLYVHLEADEERDGEIPVASAGTEGHGATQHQILVFGDAPDLPGHLRCQLGLW